MPPFGDLETVFKVADGVQRHAVIVVVTAAERMVQRKGIARTAGLDGLHDFFGSRFDGVGQFVDARRAVIAAGQIAHHMLQPHVQLQKATRHLDRPALVAEIAL